MSKAAQPSKPKRARTFRFGGATIIVIIALVQGSRFALAFHLADAGFASLFGPFAMIIDILGGLLGIATSLGIGYVASIMPGIQAAQRGKWVKVALTVLLVVAPFILAPVTVAGMDPGLRKTLDDIGSVWVWAVITASAPDLVIAAISMADKDLLSANAPTAQAAPQTAESADAVPTHSKRTATRTATAADALRAQCTALQAQCACSAPGCAWKPDLERLLVSKDPAKSASAMKAGHVRNNHLPIKVDTTLLVNKEQR